MSRADAHRNFLIDHGWGEADVTSLASDASFRQYHRLLDGERQALLMDAPPDKENIHAYVTIDSEGAPRTAGGICAIPRDLARFGEMMRLGGKNIVPSVHCSKSFFGSVLMI